MTAGDVVFIAEAEMQQANVAITLDRPTILIVLNEVAQELYAVEMMTDRTFWVASQAISGTAPAYPANYRDTIAVEVPTAATGGAREVGLREWQSVMNNSAITATADDPIYLQDAAALRISPSVTGTHYYLRSIPEITDYAQDLFAFGGATPAQCMWAFQESLILGVTHKLTLRESAQPNLEADEVKRMFDISERFKQEYDKARRPIAIFGTNTLTPTIPPELLAAQGDRAMVPQS